MAILNFKNGGIFSRSALRKPEQKQEMSGGVLAVWGSPGSGKSMLSVKLAKYIAEQRRNAALLMCDMSAPMMPCICPPSELECERSLGSILAAPHVSGPLIKYNMVTHKKFGYLAMLGMKKGENEYTYPAYGQAQAKELIKGLREIVPYIIIDCSSYIASDILSAVALMEADHVIRLSGCDLKSVSYFSSQLPLLQSNGWDEDKQYKVISNLKPIQAEEQMGSAAFRLPYSGELEQQYLSGSLFKDLSLKESRPYKKELEKIAGEVFGC